MLDVRNVDLPSRSEIRAERARRRSGRVDARFPDGWTTLEVYRDWLRREELYLLRDAHVRATANGNWDAEEPLLERVHRRASIRYMLALPAKDYRGRSFECISELERKWPSNYAGRSRYACLGLPRCACLIAAVETAASVEPDDLGRAVACARGLAKRVHRSWLCSTRAERRRAARVLRSKRRRIARTPTSGSRTAGASSERIAELTSPFVGGALPGVAVPESLPASVDERPRASVVRLLKPVAPVTDAELEALAAKLDRPFTVGRSFGRNGGGA
jgi:hypothetical protein